MDTRELNSLAVETFLKTQRKKESLTTNLEAIRKCLENCKFENVKNDNMDRKRLRAE